MLTWLPLLNLLAQNGDVPQGSPFPGFLVPMIGIAFLWYFLLFRPQNQERANRDKMLDTLKKNDRIVTIGGIIGSVANISPDGKEVTIKVDDNSRIKFLRSSIQTVLRDDNEDSSSK